MREQCAETYKKRYRMITYCLHQMLILQHAFRFHALTNKKGRNLKGYFPIDVKTIKEAWRVILQPLNENLKPYASSSIDEIAINVRIIEITEVSKHNE